MIKPGPDTGNNDANSGWAASGDLNGFSQTHVSGTGGGCKYGNIFVPQDMPSLVEKCGSKERFVQRLDAYFDGPRRFDVGNEPGFLIPSLYHYAGRPDRSAERVRRILAAHYHPTRHGLPGNDDSGAMSSLYAFDALGIFPKATRRPASY